MNISNIVYKTIFEVYQFIICLLNINRSIVKI